MQCDPRLLEYTPLGGDFHDVPGDDDRRDGIPDGVPHVFDSHQSGEQPHAPDEAQYQRGVGEWVVDTEELLLVEQQEQYVEEPQDRGHLKCGSWSIIRDQPADRCFSGQVQLAPHPDEEAASHILVHDQIEQQEQEETPGVHHQSVLPGGAVDFTDVQHGCGVEQSVLDSACPEQHAGKCAEETLPSARACPPSYCQQTNSNRKQSERAPPDLISEQSVHDHHQCVPERHHQEDQEECLEACHVASILRLSCNSKMGEVGFGD